MSDDDRPRVSGACRCDRRPPAAALPKGDPIAGKIVVNGLGGLLDPNITGDQGDPLSPRVLADAHASGLTAVNYTLGYVSGPQIRSSRACAMWPNMTCCCAAIRATC
jgi:hypothetical protein